MSDDQEVCAICFSQEVREELASASIGRLQDIYRQLDRYTKTGMMSFAPALVAMFALCEGDMRRMTIARDTVGSMLKEQE